MKKIINNLFAKFFKVQLIRTHRNIKEQPIPMVRSHVRRLIYFYELIRKIENVMGDIVES